MNTREAFAIILTLSLIAAVGGTALARKVQAAPGSDRMPHRSLSGGLTRLA